MRYRVSKLAKLGLLVEISRNRYDPAKTYTLSNFGEKLVRGSKVLQNEKSN